MPEAIRAIRSYPLTLLLAGLLFLCSLVLATASIGKILGGGEDEGSGMGGTGKSGEFGGSGFGGTGGPSPFFGITDDISGEDAPASLLIDDNLLDELALPDLLRSVDDALETAEIPRPMDPRTELSNTRPPSVPDETYIGLEPMTPARQRLQELSDAAAQDIADTEIHVEVDVADIAPPLNIAEQIEPFELPEITRDQNPEVAEAEEPNGDSRAAPERIQRPELPPFQRMRPVQGAAVSAPRPVPMRI